MDGILAGSAVGLASGVLAAALIAHLLLRSPAPRQKVPRTGAQPGKVRMRWGVPGSRTRGMLVAALIVHLLVCVPPLLPDRPPAGALWPAERWHALPHSTLECLHGGLACSGESQKGAQPEHLGPWVGDARCARRL